MAESEHKACGRAAGAPADTRAPACPYELFSCLGILRGLGGLIRLHAVLHGTVLFERNLVRACGVSGKVSFIISLTQLFHRLN